MVDLAVMKRKLSWIVVNEKLVSIMKGTTSRFERAFDPWIKLPLTFCPMMGVEVAGWALGRGLTLPLSTFLLPSFLPSLSTHVFLGWWLGISVPTHYDLVYISC